MEKLSLQYSTKNIPIPTNSEYTKKLIDKVEDFIKRLRWRVFFFLKPATTDHTKETYGFKSPKSPPFIPQLKGFEEDMLRLIEDLKFCKINSRTQNKLNTDLKKIQNETNILVPADKTNNYYSVPIQQYKKLMQDNVTTTYKRSDEQMERANNLKAKEITDELDLSDRIQALAPKPAYVTLKDHKENFRNHPTCRLINPTKSDIGIISKKILDRINKNILQATLVNQWKNSTAVIDWFKNIQPRRSTTFITFDVVNFYPTINKRLLHKAIEFAKKHTTITPLETEIIFHAKSTLLFHNDTPWQKTNADDLFDVTMGSYDGAETCELVGTYILNEIRDIIPKENIGLYRDDGLAFINKPAREAETIKKQLCEKFRQLGLQITADANVKTVNFLDVTFDLNKREYRPYSKPGNKHLYVHTGSNHPLVITNRIPQSIQTRLSNISSNEDVFSDAKDDYEKALQEAGHNTTLTYSPSNNNNNRRQQQRKRKITWFNPPYSQHVKANIGKKFLALIDKNFPKENELHKICNRNTLKISYSCMSNMETIIKAHNNKILNNDTGRTPETCNCRRKEDCPLPERCTAKNVVYEAKVHTQSEEKIYIGLTATSFKTRYTSHKASFTHRAKSNQTELSKYIWKLKDDGSPYTLTWRIKKQAQPYSPQSKRCNLCLWEKYFIITADKNTSLNSRTELISTCRHKMKYFLSEYG